MSAASFTLPTAQRILEATRRVERMAADKTADRVHRPAPLASFWAMLSSAGGLNGLHWSWVKCQPAGNLPTANDPVTIETDTPLFEFAEPHVVGYQSARESNNNQNVPPGSVVLLHFIGYDRTGEPAYVFQFHAAADTPYLPPHDHRDNQPENGGYAFAVYAPGTSLPQQPWPI